MDLACQGPHFSSLKFVFMSSISVAQSWDPTEGPYPETVIRQSRYSIGMGYGESKYVAERVRLSSQKIYTAHDINLLDSGKQWFECMLNPPWAAQWNNNNRSVGHNGLVSNFSQIQH